MLWRLVVTFLLFTVIILLLLKSTYLGQDTVCFRLVPTLIPSCSRSNLGSTQVQLWFTFGLDRTGNAVGAPVDCRWYGYKTAAEADQILKKLSSLVMGSLFYHITFKSHGHGIKIIVHNAQYRNDFTLYNWYVHRTF